MELNKYEIALYYEIFKKWEYNFLDRFIKDSEIIFDIGGHLWFFAKYCINLNPEAKIYYFEPVNNFYTKAKDFLEEDKRVIFNNKWIWINNCSKDIFINDTKSMQTSMYNNHILNKNWKKDQSEFVKLEDYLNNLNIKLIDLCKVDIEWAEIKVLENISENTLKKIKVLFFEYHILFSDFEKRFYNIVAKLKKIYINVEVIESRYSENIWYVLCY